MEGERYVLQVLKVKDGEQADKGEVVDLVTIEPERVRDAIAAGLGLPKPRPRKAKAVPAVSTKAVGK